jgi:hypothetical protein
MTDKTDTTALKALCKAQQAMTAAMKDTKNPFFNSTYADLGSVQDACMPALHANGFSVIHKIQHEDSGSTLATILLHESGWEWSCAIPLIVGKNDMQGLGSAITYARRYGLMCVSGVAPEDDDGNRAVENKPKNNKDRVGATEDKPAEPLDITADLEKVKTIHDQGELDAYYKAIKELNPTLAKNTLFLAACKAQREAIAKEEMPI